MTGRRRPMRRVSDVLPGIAVQLGLDDELRLARAMAAWEQAVAAEAPTAVGGSRLLEVRLPLLIVSASDARMGQELRLRSDALLAAFGRLADEPRARELRVVVGSSPAPGTLGGASGNPV
jgi:hypothetical protein